MRAERGWKETYFSLPEDVLPTLRLSSKCTRTIYWRDFNPLKTNRI